MIKPKRSVFQTYLNLKKLRLLNDHIFLVQDKSLKYRVLMSDRILHFSVKIEKRERVFLARTAFVTRGDPNEINSPLPVKKNSDILL